MTSSLKNDLGLALLRIASAAFMMTHGYPKLQKLISGDFEFGDPLGIGASPTLFLAVLAEFVCPILIIIGFKTRWAAILPAITMLVAAVFVHGADPFGKQEKALIYLVVFVAIILLGPGKYSIDRK